MNAEWAVRDTLTGAVYPQPNKLIAEKVAEMHGNGEVIPLEKPAEERISEPNYPGHPEDWTDEQWAHLMAWKRQEESR